MPQSLPKDALKLWEQVYDQSVKAGDDKSLAAQKAWGALKRAGWKKNAEGKWEKKSYQEFSLTIKRASFDAETNTMRWRADTTNTYEDSYGDSMSSELFADFLSRIESKESPPEEFKSEFWSGGIPYLSISHYPDLNGDAVPGEVEKVYVDGDYLKAKGTFNNTPLGKACWNAIKSDLNTKSENPVRISIAFLDYAHSHGDYTFERKSDTDICPMCLLSLLKGEMPKRQFKKGHLIHFAMTRVPVNVDTIMEEDKSMTTRMEDAASIVGEDLAEEIEQKSALIGKSEAMLVVKSEKEEDNEELGVTLSEAVTEKAATLDDVMMKVSELTTAVSLLAQALVAGEKEDETEDGMSSDNQDMEVCQACGAKKKKTMKSDVEVKSDIEQDDDDDRNNDLVVALSEVMAQTNQKLDIMIAALSNNKAVISTPERRSINPADVVRSMTTQDTNRPLSIAEIAKKSVGL